MLATKRLEIGSPERDARGRTFRVEKPPYSPPFFRQNSGSEKAFRSDPEGEEEP